MPIRESIGTVVILCISDLGGYRIIKNPMPEHKLDLRSMTDQLVALVEEDSGDSYLLDVFGLTNAGSLDATTRECLRFIRAETGVMLNPLATLPGRKQLVKPEGVKHIFWAYHR